VPDGASIGDELEVFLYKDSEDRLIATRKEPKLTLHQVGYLTVIQVSRIGAFLDWGLDKDLLLPYHEQPRERVKEGQTVLVAVYLDKSERLCATMNVYPWLRTDSPYKAGDQVSGVVYETSRNFGAFVAVDSIYSALIPRRELVRELKAGEVVQARVTSIKPDGKIDLSIREKGYLQIDADVEAILNMLNEGGGMIPFTDKAAPELIREKTHMSKNEFKRAVGHLLKENKISIEDDRIVLL
jgi:predicted RNA-binding protein (virulence factor B family)